MARAPAATLASILGRWNISLGLDTELGPDPEPDTGWSWRRNSVQKVMFLHIYSAVHIYYLRYLQVNSWKTGLSSGELRSIETKCGDALSKMEYQLLGAA